MSIINTNYGFVFVHIPKCAGTTVTNTLSQLSTMFDLEIGGTEYGEDFQKLFITRFSVYKHSTAWEIRNALGREKWTKFFSFTFVRNPYDRAYSTYKYIRTHNKQLNFLENGQSFSDFVTSPSWDQAGPFQMLKPQHRWLIAGQHRDDFIVDHIARVENFQEEIRKLLQLIGVHRGKIEKLTYEAKNVSPEPPEPPVMSQKAVDKIRTRYADDFARFGYDPAAVPFDVV